MKRVLMAAAVVLATGAGVLVSQTLRIFFAEPEGPADIQGHATIIHGADGTVVEGSYVEGRREGHWVEREPDGTVSEGPYVGGVKEGHWVIRYPDGAIFDGPYVAGKQEGQWVERGYKRDSKVQVLGAGRGRSLRRWRAGRSMGGRALGLSMGRWGGQSLHRIRQV